VILHREVENPVETLGYAAGYHREVGSLRIPSSDPAVRGATFRGERHRGQAPV